MLPALGPSWKEYSPLTRVNIVARLPTVFRAVLACVFRRRSAEHNMLEIRRRRIRPLPLRRGLWQTSAAPSPADGLDAPSAVRRMNPPAKEANFSAVSR